MGIEDTRILRHLSAYHHREYPIFFCYAAVLSMASVEKPLLPTADNCPVCLKNDISCHKKDEEDKTPWSSIYMCGLGAVIQSLQFSIYVGSMWPYLISLDPTLTETMLGFIMAGYSLAQCFGAPAFGYWSNRIEQVRIPLIFGFACMAIGNLLYLSVELVPRFIIPYIMITARFITGSGTGNAALFRTYAASASTMKDRSRAISCVTGGIAIGTMIGPGLQLLFIPLGERGLRIGSFPLNIYTAPTILAILLDFLGIYVTFYHFKEKKITYEKVKKKSGNTIELDICAIFLIIFTRFIQMFSMTTVKTLGSPYSMMMFSQNKEESVIWNSSVNVVCGIIGAIFYVCCILWDFTKKIPERLSTIFSLIILLALFLVTFSWPFIGEPVPLKINGSDDGCDADRFFWCNNLTTTSIWLYYGSYILVFGLTYSFLNIAMTTLFSKLLGRRKQGTFQGLFQMSGSLGRLLSPLAMSYGYIISGPRLVWSAEIVMVTTVIVVWLGLYRRIVPLEEKKDGTEKAIEPGIA